MTHESESRQHGPTQAEIYAEIVLENVMCRTRYTSQTRDDIAALFSQFEAGIKRKRPQPTRQNRVDKSYRQEVGK